jgi:uncharacterized membrane protein
VWGGGGAVPHRLVYPGGMRSRMLFPLLALVAASAWCVVLLVVRKHAYGDAGYPHLVWNLALAWIPLLLAILLVVSYAWRRSRVEQVAVGTAWLLFLPNAPYVLTDFIHLGASHRLFDTLIITSFAFTSLALGFASLLLVQLVVTRSLGAMLGWATALASLFAASVGIYLGRVVRLNSWDVAHRPGRLWEIAAARLADPLGNPHLIGFVLALCGFLTLAYLGLYGFTTLLGAVARRDEPTVLGSNRPWRSP